VSVKEVLDVVVRCVETGLVRTVSVAGLDKAVPEFVARFDESGPADVAGFDETGLIIVTFDITSPAVVV